MKTPVTKERLRVHWTYSWWKYLLAVLLIAALTDLLYTVTAYRPPADKVIEVYCLALGDQEGFDAYLNHINEEAEMGMERVASRFLVNDDYYGDMSLSVFLAAQEGDIYILPKDNFRGYSAEGGFLPLDDAEELIALFDEDDLASGWRRVEGERHLYGIPASLLPGLKRYLYLSGDEMICVLIANGNDENVIRFLTIMAQENLTEPEQTMPTDVTLDTIMP